MREIMTFRGAYSFLSNMHKASFEWDGRIYQNSEAAFQSAKSLDPAVRDTFSDMSGVIAKRAGKRLMLRSDWEDVKDGIMEEIVRAKFLQNPDLRQKLIDTGDMELTEGNSWHDTYWGVDVRTGRGENHLGIILMRIRAELGGAAYTDRVRQLRDEREALRRTEAAALQAEIDSARAALDALPTYDFTGMEMATKAFGRVTIRSQEGNRLQFEANGAVRSFALPGCIADGFLIPEDAHIIDVFRRRQQLEAQLKALEKGLPRAEAHR